MSEPQSVRVSIDVEVDQRDAFDVFTTEIGLWYQRNRFTLTDHRRTKTIRFEPWVGGRFLEVYDLDTGEGLELGRIVVWEPPARLVFAGERGVDVEVSFEPIPRGCRVSVEERGLERLPPGDATHVRRWGWHQTLPAWFRQHVHERSTPMTATTTTLGNLVPYLFYDDVEAMLDWYGRVFGFEEKGRWSANGRIENAEMVVGDTELWLDGGGARYFDKDGAQAGQWVGVWADDVDAMYERVKGAGVAVDPPEDKPYGVRMLTVKDPEGNSWGFMRRV